MKFIKIITGWWIIEKVFMKGGEVQSVQDITNDLVEDALEEPFSQIEDTFDDLMDI